jgi:hypothetical protein
MNQLANAHKYLVASEQLKLVGVRSRARDSNKVPPVLWLFGVRSHAAACTDKVLRSTGIWGIL